MWIRHAISTIGIEGNRHICSAATWSNRSRSNPFRCERQITINWKREIAGQIIICSVGPAKVVASQYRQLTLISRVGVIGIDREGCSSRYITLRWQYRVSAGNQSQRINICNRVSQVWDYRQACWQVGKGVISCGRPIAGNGNW